MAEEKVELRSLDWRHLFPWTEIFRGFQIALDPKKLILAAAGMLLMALGWWVLAALFYSTRTEPTSDNNPDAYPNQQAFEAARDHRRKWLLLHQAAGNSPRDLSKPDALDLANNPEDYKDISGALREGVRMGKTRNGTLWAVPSREEPYGLMRKWPWEEDRGANPYLQVSNALSSGDATPGEKGSFFSRFITDQIPVLLEPLRKFFLPVVFLFKGEKAGFWNHLYFILDLLWMIAVWGVFGGAITRMAAVQAARREKVGLRDALRFAVSRFLSFFTAPLIPLIILLAILIFLIIFGFFHLIPYLGDFVDGLGWVLVLVAGIVMAVILVGLVGWPLMYATVSTEGTDSFDALSRSYSYVFQGPWNYLWYSLVAVVYGAILVFFVTFMGSLMIYLGKWGVSQTPFLGKDSASLINPDPSYLFVYAPTSFQWRELLMQGAVTSDGTPVVQPEVMNGTAYEKRYEKFRDDLPLHRRIAAFLVSIWVYLLFMLVVGFSYSYFWTAGTIIYLLMRRKVDDTDMDEVYLEEEDLEDVTFTTPTASVAPTATPPAPGPGTTPLNVVEPPPPSPPPDQGKPETPPPT